MVVVAFQIAAYNWLLAQSWFVPTPPKPRDENPVASMENTVLFLVSSFQYIILAVVFCVGDRYRKPLCTNIPFFCSILLLTGVTVYLAVAPAAWTRSFMLLKQLPKGQGAHLLAIPLSNFVVCFVYEYLIASPVVRVLFRTFKRKKQPKNRYKRVLLELERERHGL